MDKLFDIRFCGFFISLINYKKSWKYNGVGKQFDIFTNKATLKDSCFSFTINFIYLSFNITLYDMQNNKIVKFLNRKEVY